MNASDERFKSPFPFDQTMEMWRAREGSQLEKCKILEHYLVIALTRYRTSRHKTGVPKEA